MSGLLIDGWNHAITVLEGIGLPVVSDPRNIQPPCIIVEPPSMRVMSAYVSELDIPATVIAPPPGNREAALWLLEKADEIAEAIMVTTGNPGSYTVSSTDLPAYLVNIRLTMQRTPAP